MEKTIKRMRDEIEPTKKKDDLHNSNDGENK